MTIANIPSDFLNNILCHGYLILFLLVFLQEVGVPNPIPNELVLIYSGYLSYSGLLNAGWIILSAFAGDMLGSGILFTLFFLFGNAIMERKPRWIPISMKKLDKLSRKIQRKGFAGVFLGRISPFIRGYVAVLLGLMNYPVRKYAVVLPATAMLWSVFYVMAGYVIGPYWQSVSGYLIGIRMGMGIFPLALLLYVLYRLWLRQKAIRMKKLNYNAESFE
ncbi:DedA family protein [Parabacteroides sp. FAFU027]|uniref:DedA family protein n=1 Tax=Parabacteroides sp. FAFU027 TaxID=2922715 RepID=UPI001FAFB1D7|nr:DedA family protein [Parabacteroides sp. FAFU027]